MFSMTMCPKMSLIPTILAVLCVSSAGASVGLAADEPAPPVGHFVLTKKPLVGKPEPCLLLDISAMFHVGYAKTDNTTATVSFALSNNSMVSGDCSHLTDERHAQLNLGFGSEYGLGLDGTFGLELTFERNGIFTHFYLSDATMYYKLVPDMFPDAKDANTTSSGSSKEQFFYTSSNAFAPHSYSCDKPQTMEFTFSKSSMPKSTLTIHSIHVQPFYVPHDGKFSPAETCPDLITTTPGPYTTPSPLIPVGHFSLNDTKGNPCFLLSVGMEFRVEYEGKDNTTYNATYVLPRNSTVGGACGDSKATIALSFFKGFNFTVTFKTPDTSIFELVRASVGYVRDPKLFPDAKSPGTAVNEEQTDGPSLFVTEVGKSYLCKSLQFFDVGSTVHLMVSDLQVQPFAVNSTNFSEASECAQDFPSTMMPIQNATTILPLNTTAATMAPIGNVTTVLPSNITATLVPILNGTTVNPSNVTVVPIENATTIMTTPKPTTPPKEPPQGHFEVKDKNGNACLLANMSLQFSINYTKTDKKKHTGVFDLPKTAKATGFCGSDNSSLTLTFHDDNFNVTFDFVKDKKVKGNGVSRFNVSTIEISYTEIPSIFHGTNSPDARRHVTNSTMDIFSADADKSYKCNADVDITVTKDVSILASHVQLQPFGVEKSGKFSSAEECSEDSGSNTVPVIIGVVVGVVVVVVFVAYIVVSKRKASTAKFTTLN
ncbi:lysosome-associated membrane glycoprotein 1-like [Branchiostoma floridae]|uniref:Lysosome-associated membrane glycoprotein 1-like n=2 Tax=Branchiostoma floridae TaxID=7739 RepID=A0A9J7KTD8_BRAFL|nr:lysosome-associated membrane glycoprotein 1-like [Branchiostoma floridae]